MRFFLTGHLEAGFASVMAKKKDGSAWTWKDFITLPSEAVKDIEKPKLSLKQVKERLGSKFTMN